MLLQNNLLLQSQDMFKSISYYGGELG